MAITVETKNVSSILQQIGPVLLNPGETGKVPLELATAFKQSRDFSFNWSSLEDQFLPSIKDGKLVGLSLKSPISPYDGYGLVGIHLAESFLDAGVDLSLSIGGWLRPDGSPQRLLDRLEQEPKNWRIALALGAPNDVMSGLMATRRVSYSMWESTIIPKRWVPFLNDADLVIVPAETQRPMYVDAGVTNRIEIVPCPIDTRFWSRRVSLPDANFFKIISFSRMTSRKMPIEMVVAFQRAFPRDQYPDVRFELKTQTGHFGMGSNHLPDIKDDRISIINTVWSLDQLREWVGTAHLGFFLSRGEGFFMPPLQTMAQGIPVICVDHSGPASFIDDRVAYSVRLDPNEPLVESPMGDRMQWWNPDLDHAVHQLRHAYEHYDEAKSRGRRGRDRALKYSPQAVTSKLTKLLVKLG